MAQNDFLKKYLDAGLAFTALTQARAEALVKDLVKAGEVQADQAREVVSDLLERSRRNSEKLLDAVAKEVRSQVTGLGLVSQSDLDRVEARLSRLFGGSADTPKPAAKKAAGKKTTAKKAAAKKSTAKKSPAKKSTAKKATAKKAATKKQA